MDRYDVREELGNGTFGTVFRAWNKISRKEVRRRVLLEAISKLDHFNTFFHCSFSNIPSEALCLCHWRNNPSG